MCTNVGVADRLLPLDSSLTSVRVVCMRDERSIHTDGRGVETLHECVIITRSVVSDRCVALNALAAPQTESATTEERRNESDK